MYDQETELYYLQSRYYNPAWGRFINADNYLSTGKGFPGENTYIYCSNGPVKYVDSEGTSPVLAVAVTKFCIGFASDAFSSLAGSFMSAGISGEQVDLGKAIGHALVDGLVGGVAAICPPVLKAGFTLIKANVAALWTAADGGSVGDVLAAAGTAILTDVLSCAIDVQVRALPKDLNVSASGVSTVMSVGVQGTQIVIDHALDSISLSNVTATTATTYNNPATSVTRPTSGTSGRWSRTISTPSSRNPRSRYYS